MESKELNVNARQVLKSHDFLIWAYLPRRAIKQTPPRPLMVAASSSEDMFSEWIFVRLTREDKDEYPVAAAASKATHPPSGATESISRVHTEEKILLTVK